MANTKMSDVALMVTRNRPYLAEQIADIVDKLVVELEKKGLVLNVRKIWSASNTSKFEISTALLRELSLHESWSVCKFVDCLRDLNKTRVAEILENQGIVVKVNVSFKDTTDTWDLRNLASKLNNISNYAGTRKDKVQEIISSWKMTNTDMLECVVSNNCCISIWLCCWNDDGLNRMKSISDSGELLCQFKKLFKYLKHTGIITHLEFDAAKQLDHMMVARESEDDVESNKQITSERSQDSHQNAKVQRKKKYSFESDSRELLDLHLEVPLSKNSKGLNRRQPQPSLHTAEGNARCQFCFSKRVMNGCCQECKESDRVHGKVQQLKIAEEEPIIQTEGLFPASGKFDDDEAGVCSDESLTESETSTFNMILCKLRMDEYYPRKLQWIEVITIDSSAPKNSNNICLEIVRGLMRLDYTAPNKDMPLLTEINDSHEQIGISIGDDLDQSIIEGPQCLHPMDVFNIILNCCDTNLLQILTWKLFQCQLSIPVIFPNMYTGSSVCLLWALRMIVPECKIDSGDVKQNCLSLVDIPQPVISFMRIGRLEQSKSKILNFILRSKDSHHTFFHRECEYGESERRISNGTIEATWFQPSGSKNDNFNKMFTILNLRGDATDHHDQAVRLTTMACLNIIMIDTHALKDKTYKKFVDSCTATNSFLCFVVIFVVSSTRDIEIHIPECKTCVQYFKEKRLAFFRVLQNWKTKEILNEDKRKKMIQEVICDFFNNSTLKKTFIEMVDAVRKTGGTDKEPSVILVDEDDCKCTRALKIVRPIVDLLNNIHPTQQRKLLLPLQGELWKQVTELQKKLRRGLVMNSTLENSISEIEDAIKKARLGQLDLLQHSNSAFVDRIWVALTKNKENRENQYIVNWFKIFLDGSSRSILPELNAQYHAKWNEYQRSLSHSFDPDVRRDHTTELSNMAHKMLSTSLGIEHVFRELGQIYEAVKLTPYAETANNRIIRSNAMNLPDLMAELVLQGCYLEMMDGDTAFVPITWMKAVFSSIQKRIDQKKIFVMSIVGIQSSGKSTFLNTMFGLQFPVSAGRCTNGVYCQMIPVNKSVMNVDYDYILVVDTEGLAAPELQNAGNNHDNVLATFVIGLGNVTVVNIKGETDPNLQNILQIVIHAMIRIKYLSKVQLNPSCIFVHQNVAAANAEDKLKFGKEQFLTQLDKVTEAAATQEQIENIQTFKQVINYDEYKHAFYMPDLWQGNPPMAPVNYEYSGRIYDIRQMLINDISRRAKTVTIEQFVSKLEDLWGGILGENFVFSFKNSAEVRAFSLLDKYFSKLTWDMQKASSKIQQQLSNAVFSPNIRSLEELDQLKKQLNSKAVKYINNELQGLQFELNDHFENNANKDILEQWKEQYLRRLKSAADDEENRMKEVISEYFNIKILQLNTNEYFDRTKFEIMKEIEQNAVDYKHRKRSLDENDLQNYFVKIWRSIVQKYQSRSDPKSDTDFVLFAIETALRSSFQMHMVLLEKELTSSSLNDFKNSSFNSFMRVFINDLILKRRNIIKQIRVLVKPEREECFKKRCLASAQEGCNQVFREATDYIGGLKGKDFQPCQVTTIIRMTEEFFQKMDSNQEKKDKSEYNFSIPFRIRFTVYICKCATDELIKLRTFFRQKTDPIARISDYRLPFYQYFKCQCKEIEKDCKDKESASTVAAYFIEWIAQAISKNYDQILVDLIGKDAIFGNKNEFTKKILNDLLDEKNFYSYMEYLKNNDLFVMDKIRSFVEAWIGDTNNKTGLDQRVRKEIRKYKSLLLKSIKKLEGYFSNLENYLEKLGQNLENKIPYDARFVQKMQIRNSDNFKTYLIQVIENDATEASYFIRRANTRFDFVVYELSKRVCGCLNKCPLCKAPCCLSGENHAGEHQVLQHYPLGLTGIQNSDKLCTYNCQSVIDCDWNYVFDPENPQTSTHPIRSYKKYHPKWEIKPDRSNGTSLYWKWFMANFNEDLARYHDSSAGDIPEQWRNITMESAKQSLDS